MMKRVNIIKNRGTYLEKHRATETRRLSVEGIEQLSFSLHYLMIAHVEKMYESSVKYSGRL